MDGVLVLDKPEGWTSHDAVSKVRHLAKLKKVGHLGTLDPMATGVLPLVVGKATRLAQFYTRADKCYEGTIRFGWATTTYDREGETATPTVEPEVTAESLESLFAGFRGTFLQTPPPVSAKKVGGTAAYHLARRNLPVELAPVEVTVHSLELTGWTKADARIRVHCSAGTYLRSIAHEVGRLSGYGAHLQSLRRTRCGAFGLSQARTIAEVEELAAAGRLEEAIIPAVQLLPEFPCQEVDALTAGQIRQGRDFRISPFGAQAGARYVKAIGRSGELLAIGEARLPLVYHPILVLA